jgi:trehalose 6-phosphate synthase
VLSRTAGAAEELPEAVIVNPYVANDAAAGIQRALTMPEEERRERHRALLARVLSNTAADWSTRFLRDLEASDPVPDPVLQIASAVDRGAR